MYEKPKTSRLLSRGRQSQASLTQTNTSAEDVYDESAISPLSGRTSMIVGIEQVYERIPTLPEILKPTDRNVACKSAAPRREVNINNISRPASRADSTTLPPSRPLLSARKPVDLIKISQKRASHELRIEATRQALTFAAKALPFGAGNLAVDIYNSGGMNVPLIANAHSELKKRKEGGKKEVRRITCKILQI